MTIDVIFAIRHDEGLVLRIGHRKEVYKKEAPRHGKR